MLSRLFQLSFAKRVVVPRIPEPITYSGDKYSTTRPVVVKQILIFPL